MHPGGVDIDSLEVPQGGRSPVALDQAGQDHVLRGVGDGGNPGRRWPAGCCRSGAASARASLRCGQEQHDGRDQERRQQRPVDKAKNARPQRAIRPTSRRRRGSRRPGTSPGCAASRIAGRHPRTRCPPPRSAGRRGPPSGSSSTGHHRQSVAPRPTATCVPHAGLGSRSVHHELATAGLWEGEQRHQGQAIGGAPRDQHIGQPPAAAVGRPADVDHTARPPPAPRRAAAPAPRAAPPPRRGWPRPDGPAPTPGRGG